MNIIHPSANIHASARLGNFITIEANCDIGEGAFIGNCCTLRPNTKIGKRTKVGHCAVFEGDCTTGDDCLIQAQTNITRGMTIEDSVFIGQMVCFGNDKKMCHLRGPWELCAPIVRYGARIGMGATVLPGVEIGVGCIIGAGSVVTKNTEPRRIYRGNPARNIGPVMDDILFVTSIDNTDAFLRHHFETYGSVSI